MHKIRMKGDRDVSGTSIARRALILTITLVILSIIGSGAVAAAETLTTPSANTRLHSSGELVYCTDFEYIYQTTDHHLTMPVPHWFEFGGDGGAFMWMDDALAHSGRRSVGMMHSDIRRSRRAEFNLDELRDWVGNTITISVWLYLPYQYRLGVEDIDWNWHEFFVLSAADTSSGYPYLRLIISQPNIAYRLFDLSLGGRDPSGTPYTYGEAPRFHVPRGEWFNVSYYLERDPQAGTAIVWVNGEEVFNVQGVSTAVSTDADYRMSIAKLYFDEREPADQYIWVDDLEVYSGYVEPQDMIYSAATEAPNEPGLCPRESTDSVTGDPSGT